ncbi:hypothetical protein B0T19DRAFT_419593 [Cercophora scortea]|uniref:Uncharacterized protein n=1 Tax=Cercophora scortea TaxID=314031 RepID=A0AAE0IZ44_9PEZI|nr:hypothetical protein B0T19DRAFT_419593 [Cercophora scortea]
MMALVFVCLLFVCYCCLLFLVLVLVLLLLLQRGYPFFPFSLPFIFFPTWYLASQNTQC